MYERKARQNERMTIIEKKEEKKTKKKRLTNLLNKIERVAR